MTRRLALDIVSDVICPWCWIGKRRLETALTHERGIAERLDVRWRPWQLAPGLPTEGVDRRAYYERKFPDADRRRAIESHLLAEGETVGIRFDFDRIARVPDTFDAHRLIRWAGSAGVQAAVVESLFAAHFAEGRDIGARRTLIEIASDCGMDADLVARLYEEDRDRALVTREIAAAGELGITGVPTFVFAGRFVVQGAQPVAVFRNVLRRLDEALGAAGAARASSSPG